MSRETRWLIRACFFVSGSTSLILEVAWAKELSYILGNTLLAVSTVVAAFMAGLGIGSAWISRVGARIERPIRAYAIMEILIAAAGAVSIPLFRSTQPVFEWIHLSFAAEQGPFLLIRFLVVFLLLFVPVVLMGATLPVVVGAAARSERRDTREAGILYGVNTLGAVAGTIVASFALLPLLGILRTCLVAGSLDLLVAFAAFAVYRRSRAAAPLEGPVETGRPSQAGAQSRSWSRAQWTVAVLFGISGAVAIALEVAWFRILGLTLGPSVYAFASMLAVYLLGVGLGSALAAGWAERTGWGGIGAMAVLEALLGLAGLAGLFYANALPSLHIHLFQSVVSGFGTAGLPVSHLLLAGTLVFAPCLVMGAIFPAAVRAIQEAGRDQAPETNVGRLYLGNTAGGIAGSLLAGFLLIPHWGVWNTILAGGLLSVGLGLAFGCLALLRARGPARLAFALPAAAAAAVLLAVLTPPWDLSRFNAGAYRELYSGEADRAADPGQLIFHREGLNAPVAVYRTLGSAALHVGGKPDASTNYGDVLTQSLLGHLPVLLAESPREVAVIGYGSGMTAGTVLTHPQVEKVDILEIERGVIEASPYFASINGNPLDDPRANLILEDGRIHLTYASTEYDVITSEPSNPWMAGIANLFTADFYDTVRKRLRPGGIFAQWIQNYDLSEEALAVILASLRASFPHLIVFQSNPWDLIVIASERPVVMPWEEIERRVSPEPVRRSLARAGIHDPLELGFFLLGPEEPTLEIAAGARGLNTDDNTWLEHRAPYEMLRLGALNGTAGEEHAGRQLLHQGASRRLHALAELAPGMPMESAVRAIVFYPYRWEPGLMQPAIFSDPWAQATVVQVPGLVAELRASGGRDGFPRALADSIPLWNQAGREYRERRAEAARNLHGSGQNPDKIREAMALAPDLPAANVLYGALRLSEGDIEEARRSFESVLANPESGSVYFALLGMAQAAAAEGDGRSALGWSRAAIDRNPYAGNAFAFAAELYLSAGETEAARSVLQDGLRLNPHHQGLIALLSRTGQN